MIRPLTRFRATAYVPLILLLLLGACTGQGGQPINPINAPVTVDLKTAKYWSQEITDAIGAFIGPAATAVSAKVPAATLKQAQDAYAALVAANQQFQGLPEGATTVRDIGNVLIAKASQLVTLLSPFIPALAAGGPVGQGIQIGLVVVGAAINAIAMVTPPVPAALHTAAVAHRGHE